MKTIHLAPGIDTGLATLIDSRALVQANSGGGKSWCLRRLLEQAHGAAQQLVLDPEGEFPSLREKYDYVLAAKHGGDTAAEPRAAGLLAQRLLELGVSAIVDLYELKAHERVRFVRLFLEALVDAPKKLWHPVLVVLDEAHVFCPQQGEAESAGAVIDLCTRGRKRGFGAVLATQRLSKLHKDAAAELNNKLIGRTGLDVDVKRAADELGFGKERWRELRELEPGEFFLFGPAMTREVKKARIGPVSTTHPKAGARLTSAAPPPTEQIKALLPKLSDLPAEQERKARTEAELQEEIRSLRGQLSAAERRVPAPAAAKVKEVPVLKDAQVKRLETIAQAEARMVERHLEANAKTMACLKTFREALAAFTSGPSQRRQEYTPAFRSAPPPPAPRPAQRPAPRHLEGNGHGGALPRARQNIVDRLAWLESVGVSPADRTMLALWCDVSPTSGGFFNNLGALRSSGLIDYPSGGTVALTADGQAAAHAPEPLSVEEMQAAVLRKVGESKAKILREAIAAYPEPIDKDELADRIGVSKTSGGYFNNLGALRSMGVIDYPTPGKVVALPVLFLER